MDLFQSENFGNHVNELLEKWHVPGAAIALVHDERTTSRAFGEASLDPPNPFTTDTLVDIASSSKSMTAAAVALLVADNEHYPQVQWDSKMSDLLPEDFVMSSSEYTNGVTVEDILSHRTGLPSCVSASDSSSRTDHNSQA